MKKTKNPKLILASQSPARRRGLKRLGFRFRVLPAHLNESAFLRKYKSPVKLALALAEAKASHVWMKHSPANVIGSDQLLVCKGKVYGKPGTVKKAELQLRKFSGQVIELLTAVCVIDSSGEKYSFCHRTKMRFRTLTVHEIRDYVRKDLPIACAGSFMFERHGVSLFDSIETDDPTAIEGLPLLRLNKILLSILGPI